MLNQSIINYPAALYKHVLFAAPAIEVIDLYTAKLHAKIDLDLDDPLLPTMITAARTKIESYLDRALITQTWDAYYTMGRPYYGVELRLPRAKVQSIVSVDYSVTGATPIVCDPTTDYYMLGDRVILTGNFDLSVGFGPSLWSCGPITGNVSTSWHVQYTCGYGTTVDTVPDDLVLGNLMLFAYYYGARAGGPSPRYRAEATGSGSPAVSRILEDLAHYRNIQV